MQEYSLFELRNYHWISHKDTSIASWDCSVAGNPFAFQTLHFLAHINNNGIIIKGVPLTSLLAEKKFQSSEAMNEKIKS